MKLPLVSDRMVAIVAATCTYCTYGGIHSFIQIILSC
jgi:hypothetical protein